MVLSSGKRAVSGKDSPRSQLDTDCGVTPRLSPNSACALHCAASRQSFPCPYKSPTGAFMTGLRVPASAKAKRKTTRWVACLLVRMAGLEPATVRRQILSLMCMPIPPHSHTPFILGIYAPFVKSYCTGQPSTYIPRYAPMVNRHSSRIPQSAQRFLVRDVRLSMPGKQAKRVRGMLVRPVVLTVRSK